jgi:hypothetical protein
MKTMLGLLLCVLPQIDQKGAADYTTPSEVIGSFEKKTDEEIDLTF